MKETYIPLTVNNMVTVTGSEDVNGARNTTLSLQMTLTSPLVASGSIIVRLPKANINYLDLGTSGTQTLITDGDVPGTTYTVQVLYGMIASTSLTEIP